MEVYNTMPMKDIVESKVTFRELVTSQYIFFEQMKFNLVISQRTSLHDIVSEKQVICMCHGNDQLNTKIVFFMRCCGHLFHHQCITCITQTTGICPACSTVAPPIVAAAKQENDIVREASVKKRKKAQIV
jgi:hypothetical protein